MCILKLENRSNYGSDKLTDPCQKLLTQWPVWPRSISCKDHSYVHDNEHSTLRSNTHWP